MFTFFTVILLLLLITIIIFAFPQFSPIPYFPSNRKDMSLILDALHLQNHQIVIDMGAGDGLVIFEAAQKAYANKLNTRFIAIDINPILVGIMYLRRQFHPNKKNIYIARRDMFAPQMVHWVKDAMSNNVKQVTLYAYISPRYLENVVQLATKLKTDTQISIVSYFYPIPSLKPSEKNTAGIHDIFQYKI